MTTTDIPAEARNLGDMPLAEYTTSSKKQRGNLILGGVLAALGGIGILAGPIVALLNKTGTFSQALCISGLGLFFVFLGGLNIFTTLRQRGTRAFVFPAGVAYTKNGKTTTFRWDDVTEVFQNVTRHYRNGVYTGTTHVYTVHTASGEKLVFKDTLENVEKLGQTIQQECTRRILPHALERYNAGETISFGKLNISKAGVSNGKETLPWDQVEGVSLDKGVIAIRKEGKWLRWSTVTVPQVPNIFVFTAIVDHIVGINKRK